MRPGSCLVGASGIDGGGVAWAASDVTTSRPDSVSLRLTGRLVFVGIFSRGYNINQFKFAGRPFAALDHIFDAARVRGARPHERIGAVRTRSSDKTLRSDGRIGRAHHVPNRQASVTPHRICHAVIDLDGLVSFANQHDERGLGVVLSSDRLSGGIFGRIAGSKSRVERGFRGSHSSHIRIRNTERGVVRVYRGNNGLGEGAQIRVGFRDKVGHVFGSGSSRFGSILQNLHAIGRAGRQQSRSKNSDSRANLSALQAKARASRAN